MDIRELLEKVRGGKLEIDAAEKYLRRHFGGRAHEGMGYAQMGKGRERGFGFSRGIYWQGESGEILPGEFPKVFEEGGGGFGYTVGVPSY